MPTPVVARRQASAAKQRQAPVVAATETTTESYAGTITANFTLPEFKSVMGINSFEVLKHKTNGKMFMSSFGKSIGAVSSKTDLNKELQVIEIQDNDDDLLTVYVLCNRGEGSNYDKVGTY